jgi:hypothetical protein
MYLDDIRFYFVSIMIYTIRLNRRVLLLQITMYNELRRPLNQIILNCTVFIA